MTFEQKLDAYAKLLVDVGVNLQAGQRLMVSSLIDNAPLVRLASKHAYQAGARLVEVFWRDEQLELIRFENAPEDSLAEVSTSRIDAFLQGAERGDAILDIRAANPDLLKDQNPEHIAIMTQAQQKASMAFYDKLSQNAYNWCISAVPITSWAEKVFPEASSEDAMERLWQNIFKMTRLDEADPVKAWQAHIKKLKQRCEILNEKRFKQLKYQAPHTNLMLGLVENHVWIGGQIKSQRGIPFTPNMPTEEVFTMPHKDKVDGTVTSTKPLSYAGMLIENFSLSFEAGRVVKATAQKGEGTLLKLLETDEGAARLGEVALVPHSSPVSQTGLLFYNTLFDENASCHLALGKCIGESLKNGIGLTDTEIEAQGGNQSMTHVDFMMGSAEMDIDGIHADGTKEPVMRQGEWSF